MRAIALAGLIALAVAGCDDVCPTGECETRAVVSRQITFATEVDGVSEGFDLDGIVSDGSDPESCRQPDYLGPDGTEGVDNQFAVLWDAIVTIAGDAVEGLVQGAIADGSLLLMVEVDGIDDPVYDDCVGVGIFMGAGKPDIGTDGLITTGQTFDMAPTSPYTRIDCAEIRDGVVLAGPFDGIVPVQILDVGFELEVHDAHLRGTLREDGSMDIVLGAGVPTQQIIDVANDADGFDAGVVIQLVNARADMARDDELQECTQISATILVDGASAFVFEEAE